MILGPFSLLLCAFDAKASLRTQSQLRPHDSLGFHTIGTVSCPDTSWNAAQEGGGQMGRFSRYSQPKRASFDTKWNKMIQNDTIQVLQEGPYNYRVTTATFASKGHEQVQTVQTLPRLASPHTGHVEPTWDHTPFSIAVAAYNIQEPKSQKSKISNHSVHSDTFRYIHILQGSLCKWNRSQQNWC